MKLTHPGVVMTSVTDTVKVVYDDPQEPLRRCLRPKWVIFKNDTTNNYVQATD